MPSGEQARVLILEEIPGVTMKSWCETFEKASLEEKAVLRESLVRIVSVFSTAAFHVLPVRPLDQRHHQVVHPSL